MKPPGDRDNQPHIWLDNEERRSFFTRFAKSAEDLGVFLVLLRSELPDEPADEGTRKVVAELDDFIELAFQKSEAYQLALTLYRARYELVGSPEELLRGCLTHIARDDAGQGEERGS